MRKFSKMFTNLRMDLRFGEEELKLLQRLLLLLSVFRALLAKERKSSEAELLLRKLLVAIVCCCWSGVNHRLDFCFTFQAG